MLPLDSAGCGWVGDAAPVGCPWLPDSSAQGDFRLGAVIFFPFCRAVFDCCLPALLVAIHFCFGAICYDTVLKLLLPFPYLVLNIFRKWRLLQFFV
jgi:hypothetical protein